MKDFNCETVPEQILRRANECVQLPNFTEKDMRSVSKSCGEMGAWVLAVLNCANLAKEAKTISLIISELKD